MSDDNYNSLRVDPSLSSAISVESRTCGLFHLLNPGAAHIAFRITL